MQLKIIVAPVSFILTLLLVELAPVSKANEPLCYIKTSNYQVIDLTQLCGAPHRNALISHPSRNTLEQVPNDRSIAYIDAFCQARAEELTPNQAEERARALITRLTSIQNISSTALSDTWFRTVKAEAEGICPS